MADDPKKRGPKDRSRINVNQDYELQHWSQKLGVSRERLKEIVGKVGPMVANVRKKLAK